MTYHIRTASIEDAVRIAPLLREADKNEIEAMSACSPLSALAYSIATSKSWIACRPDEVPLAIFGVGNDVGDGVGIPWMVGTDEMLKYPKSLVRDARKWVEEQLNTYAILMNYVDARNIVHVNWLRHIGFTVSDTKVFVGQDHTVPFLIFHRSK